jgi:manganese-dependent inorganic pyrophosphatase
MDNDYDPVGGHTKEEADAAYDALFRELHGGGGADGADAKREKIVVVGHKNPDTDSICAAIAYAWLKNALDPGNTYIPCRAGRLNEETAFVLAHFGVDVPCLLEDVKARIEDIDIRRLPGVPQDMSLREAWALMKERNIVTLPVAEGGDLLGLVTVKDIGKVYLDNNRPTILSEAQTPLGNVAHVLDGTILIGEEGKRLTQGKVTIAASEDDLFAEYTEPHDIVIVSNRDELQRIALYKNAACLIVTMGARVTDMIKNLARERGAVVVTTQHSTFTAARLINQAIPVRFAMAQEGIISFSPHTLLSDVKKVMSKKRHRDFPVLGDDGKYIGMISRRFLLDAPKRKAILVDHNERSQAVDGIDEAQILEIIDHHRLAPIETIDPVYFRNEPFGSTCTIVYGIFREHGIEPPKEIAGLLCSAILSDTLQFRSPTTTQQDRTSCALLANLCGVDIEDYAPRMFSAGAGADADGADPADLLQKDFKVFHVGEKALGISQINFMDREGLEQRLPALADALAGVMEKKGVDMVFSLLTNIPAGESDVIFAGEGAADLIEAAFQKPAGGGRVTLKGVVSRKKQFVPELLQILQDQI